MANLSSFITNLSEKNIYIWNLFTSELFWAAVGAIATLVTLILFIKQIPAQKRQMALHNLDGLSFIRDQLFSKDFIQWKTVMVDTWKQQNREFPNYIWDEIANIFGRINGIHLLLRRGVVDKELFMELFASEIYEIERPIRNFETLPGSKIKNARSSYPGAYRLMIACREYERKKTRKSFVLLNHFQD